MANLLIVDDKEGILDSFSFHFKAVGWAVYVARNGLEAIELLKEKREFFSGIILDKNMPGATGDQVVRWLYDEQLLDDICVVLFTGYPETKSAIDALRMGVWQYLIKDLTPTEVQTFIAPGIALKLVRRMRKELWQREDLETVLKRIEEVVSQTLSPDGLHIIFLSKFLSLDLMDGSKPDPNREFVKRICNGSKFISARSRNDVAALEPVLPDAGTLMAVPVIHNGTILGVLEMECLNEGAFDPRWHEVLTSLAETISITQVIHERIENARRAAEEQAARIGDAAKREAVRAHEVAEREKEAATEHARQVNLAQTNSELFHRIGNSLSIIKQSAADLGAEALPFESTERVGFIASHAQAIQSVLEELKRIAEPVPIKKVLLNVAEIAREIQSQMLRKADDVKLSLQAPAQANAWADRDRLRDVLICVVRNAFEAIDDRRVKDRLEDMRTDYRVDMLVEDYDNAVSVRVIDNGVGFNKAIKERLFNPLFSTKRGRSAENMGMGLYSSERAIKGLGGTIDGNSVGPYQGAEFTISLPKTE